MELTRNYINGEWVESVTRETFPSLNPATGEVVGIVTRSNHVDVQRAVEAARAAFPAWKWLPAPSRGEIVMSNRRRPPAGKPWRKGTGTRNRRTFFEVKERGNHWIT